MALVLTKNQSANQFLVANSFAAFFRVKFVFIIPLYRFVAVTMQSYCISNILFSHMTITGSGIIT